MFHPRSSARETTLPNASAPPRLAPPWSWADGPARSQEHPSEASAAPRSSPVSLAQSRLPAERWLHCPHMGLRMAPDVVELWPGPFHACFAAGRVNGRGHPVGELIPEEKQARVCLSLAGQRSCPCYVMATSEQAPEAERPAG